MEGGHRQALHMSGITDRQRRLGGKKGNRAELRKTEDRPPASCGRRRWDTVFLWKTKDGAPSSFGRRRWDDVFLHKTKDGTMSSCGRRRVDTNFLWKTGDRRQPFCGRRGQAPAFMRHTVRADVKTDEAVKSCVAAAIYAAWGDI